MLTGRNPWEEDYRRRGRLWGGSAPPLPERTGPVRILELGCGDGKTAASLAEAGYCVTAIDFSPCAVRLCRHSCPDPDLVRVLVADIRTAPFRTGSFDAVMASHVTGHLAADGRRLLAGEIFRILVPGGTLTFRDFSCGDFRYGRGEETEAGTFQRKNGIATHYFSEDEVRTLFSGLLEDSLVRESWTLRVRGTHLPREEIVAEFHKPPGTCVSATNPL